MKLPFLSKKQDAREFFLALLLTPGEVRSILFEKMPSGLLILGTSTQEFAEHLDSLTSDKLLELSDLVISEVEQKLPDGGSFEKVIFSVPHSWIFEGKIIKDHLSKLKSLCEALKLAPVGFIVSIEAVIAYLHKKEGLPVTAVLVEVSAKHVTLTLVKNGTILHVFESVIDKNVLTTVEKLLASQQDLDVLPSKIILLNYEHAKKIQQSFLSHVWPKSIQFLHIPQVEVLDTEVEAQAVISGVATQMGFNTSPDVDLKTMASRETPLEIPLDEKSESADSAPEFAGENVGFFKEIDVLKKETLDVAEEVVPEGNIQKIYEAPKEKAEDNALVTASHFPKMSLPPISFNFLSKNPMHILPRGKSFLLYPILAVLLFIAVIVSYYYFFEKVQVVLFLDKKSVNKELTVTFSRDKQTSGENLILHVNSISTQETGKEDTTATGKKETGDKAKGEVTIYNKTDSPKIFAKGTQLTGPNSLVFDLTEDVKVASTSSFSTTFSNEKGNVTADKFGKEYNLPSASNFQFKDAATADFFAKNESAFSGGTKKDITVVSAEDLASLQSQTIKSLSQKAVQDSEVKKASGAEILSLPLEYSFDDKSFSKKEGDEATNVSLTATITYILGSYKKSDLVSLAKGATQKDAPSDYTYSGKDSEIKVADISQDKDGVVSGKLVFSSVFLPQVSPATFPSEIAGKSIERANQIIQVKGVTDDQILFLRSLPFFPKLLPFNHGNIQVVTKTQ